MKKIENKIMLITYADSMSRDLKELDDILAEHFRGVIGGLHVLPFYPSSGDRGFAVINYDIVDPAFGTWDDIDHLAGQYYMMADFMLNHVSIRSEEFKDYMKNGDSSPYKDMFIHWEDFWPDGNPTKEQYDMLYRRKQTYPYIEFTRDDGKKVHLWNTFFQEQIDIDPYSKATQDYYERNLGIIRSHVPLVRFDAFAYATKRPGTTCFFVEPDVWDVLDIGMEPLRKTGTEMLPEIHENYHIQLKMAEKGYWVYDFALPMLLLHGLKTGRTDRLIHWLNICPRKQFTTLDTHDGIGVVDVAGLLTEEEIDIVRDDVNEISKEMFNYIKLPSMIKDKSGRFKTYQLGCTYYSALHCDDNAYLLARAVQFFTPGIPQVYYVGLLAGENDMEKVKAEPDPRNINRHTYTREELEKAVQKPVCRRLYELMRFRNSCDAFNGDITIEEDKKDGTLHIIWKKDEAYAALNADFRTLTWEILYYDKETGKERRL